ncbi:MAG TPA: 3-deoxy-manno-octulosonate cytidylyltransferase [Nitrospirales bacterium]|nr:3-deoxy-manno-octulosonate cytidylyltransferase [Nitrospirales bacterium]
MNIPDSLVSLCIPARYGSSRFPGKPLARLAGKPLIQRVYEAVQYVSHVGQIMVITDQEAIEQEVRNFGGEVCLVKESCRTGTDRVAKVASQLKYDVIVNLQADEIPQHPGLLDDLILPFVSSQAGMGTLKRSIHRLQDLDNPAIVKVVTDANGRALYFSRSPIPCWRDGVPTGNNPIAYMHLGVYIFRKSELSRFAGLPTGLLEDVEKLEQLRALEHGLPIMVWETAHESIRIDTPEDIIAAEDLLSTNSRVPMAGAVKPIQRVENR